MTAPQIPRNVVVRLLAVASRAGLDIPMLLSRTGISPDVLTDAQAPVTVDQASELTHELWILTGDELFGLGPPAPLGLFRLLMQSVIHVPDLSTALQRLLNASRVIPAMPLLEVEFEGPRVWVAIDLSELDDPDHLMAELLASFFHRLLNWMSGVRVPLRELTLPWAPPLTYTTEYETVFGVQPTFGAERLALAFDATSLRSPVVRGEHELSEFLEDQPHIWFAHREWGTTVADRVRIMFEQGLQGRWPTSDDIAARLNISTQHLRRQLREHGTSLGQLRQEVLRDAAIASLRRGDESVEHLAARLGFSEASAFRRAFRRWTNAPPSTYRAGLSTGEAGAT